MSFSEKMRESLGAEGVRLSVELERTSAAPGQRVRAKVTLRGGTRPARVEAVVARVVEADRYWHDQNGARVAEEDAQGRADRRSFAAAWIRNTVADYRTKLGLDLAPHELHETTLEIPVPPECLPTTVARSHSLAIQADVKGQIDPTAVVRIEVG